MNAPDWTMVFLTLSLALPALGARASEWNFTGLTDTPPSIVQYFAGGMEGSVAYDSREQTPVGTGAVKIVITEASPTGNSADGQVWIQSETGLAPGGHRLTMLCRGAGALNASLAIILREAPYTQVSLPGSRPISIGPDWTEVEWFFRVLPGHETEPLRTPLILLGRSTAAATMWIASVRIEHTGPLPDTAARPAFSPGDERPLIGAIRWDAWHTPWSRVQAGADDGPVKAMIRSLGPKRYHHRLPFFAKVVSDEAVSIDGYTQEIMDQEIAFARAGGLDYWAFLLYEPDWAMSQGLSLYLSSPRKAEVRFCAIAGANTFGDAGAFHDRMQRIVDLMSEPSYIRVLGDRPLLYIFRATDDWVGAWGGRENARRLFDDLRTAVRAAGHGDPYLVAMNDSPEQGKQVADIIGAEAITAYAVSTGGRNGTPYAELAAGASAFWEACAATGAATIPLAMAGWDRRPRAERPVPWETWQEPGQGVDRYYAAPTPAELSDHIDSAMCWAFADRQRCPAQAVITYAWNEHDEGGWLCPTLGADSAPDTTRLDAIARMLRERWTPAEG